MTDKSPKPPSFWQEIKRRKVVRVVVAYLLVGWGLIQIADATIDPLRLPEWADTLGDRIEYAMTYWGTDSSLWIPEEKRLNE